MNANRKLSKLSKIATLAVAVPVLASTGTALAGDAQSGTYKGNICSQTGNYHAGSTTGCALAVYPTSQKVDFRLGVYDGAADGKAVKVTLTVTQSTSRNGKSTLTGTWDVVNHGGKGTTQVGSNRTFKRASGMNFRTTRLCLYLVDGSKISELGCESSQTNPW